MASIIFENEADIEYVRLTLRQYEINRDKVKSYQKSLHLSFEEFYVRDFTLGDRWSIIKKQFWQWFFWYKMKDLAWRWWLELVPMHVEAEELYVRQWLWINTRDLTMAIDAIANRDGTLILEQKDIELLNAIEDFNLKAEKVFSA